MLHDIGERAGKYLNNDNWINAVINYGKVNIMVSKYGSLHTGKYDADDTFAPSVPTEDPARGRLELSHAGRGRIRWPAAGGSPLGGGRPCLPCGAGYGGAGVLFPLVLVVM